MSRKGYAYLVLLISSIAFAIILLSRALIGKQEVPGIIQAVTSIIAIILTLTLLFIDIPRKKTPNELIQHLSSNIVIQRGVTASFLITSTLLLLSFSILQHISQLVIRFSPNFLSLLFIQIFAGILIGIPIGSLIIWITSKSSHQLKKDSPSVKIIKAISALLVSVFIISSFILSLPALIALLILSSLFYAVLTYGNDQCLFKPKCKDYLLEAIEIHGVIKGSILGYKRIFRCDYKKTSGGINPVPPPKGYLKHTSNNNPLNKQN